MKTFVVLRRNGWDNPRELEVAAKRSARVGTEQMSDKVRWIRSYVLDEGNGKLGTVCIYQAVDADALRTHARMAELPADSVIPVGQTLVVNPDPAEVK